VTITQYLNAKYGEGGPGSKRFTPDPNKVHSSQVSECQRKRWWKHTREYTSGPSPYFELGRVFEVLYGAALAFEHCPAISKGMLKKNQPWEIVEKAIRVKQDVGITIELDDHDIVGECDWVVFTSDVTFDHITVHNDGSRTVTNNGEKYEFRDNLVEKVVETKTKKDIEWTQQRGPDKKHVYQVYPYMHALDCPGEIAYMQRNDWEEYVVPIEYDTDVWTDVLIRSQQHARNMNNDELPPTSPLDKDECHWCPFVHECQDIGGLVWN